TFYWPLFSDDFIQQQIKNCGDNLYLSQHLGVCRVQWRGTCYPVMLMFEDQRIELTHNRMKNPRLRMKLWEFQNVKDR
uniref:Uncharacterized protein n=1 Tax=Romanomermis culicivorax TaxID=13658 RepID=A0A915LCH0_ROMCU